MRKWFALTVGIAVAGCAAPLLQPPMGDFSSHGAKEITISYKSGALEGWVARTTPLAKPQAFILEFTGNATRAEEIASADALDWLEHPVEVWAFNYPGYGRSTGPARMTSIPDAALAAYDALAIYASGRPIFISGKSMGSATALYVATQRPVAGLILQNPPPLKDIVLDRFGWWNLWLGAAAVAAGIPPQLDSMKNAKEIKAPAVFFSAKDDGLVPPNYQRDVIDAYAGPKEIVFYKGGHHDDPRDSDDRGVHRAINWLWQCAMPAVESAHVHERSGEDREAPQGNRSTQLSLLHRE